MDKKTVNTGNSKNITLASIILILLFFVIAYIKPIPLIGGRYFYFVEPTIQYFLRNMLFVMLFIMVEVGLIAVYVWIVKMGFKAIKKIPELPDLIDKKISQLIK